MHDKLLKKIEERSSREDLIGMTHTMKRILDYLEENAPSMYDELETSLYEIVNGKTISEELGKEWVSKMKPFGQHWTMEQTNSVMRDYASSLSPIEFYVVMNMLYNDFHEVVPDENVEMYARFSKAWLQDEDAKKNKLYCYYKNIIAR